MTGPGHLAGTGQRLLTANGREEVGQVRRAGGLRLLRGELIKLEFAGDVHFRGGIVRLVRRHDVGPDQILLADPRIPVAGAGFSAR